ncbi:MAG: HEAT repeat domain-containing protein [Polyangiaceae bacterium]|nr:HEAT repeat domain-containing protein [Polyangiaceae bacterium]
MKNQRIILTLIAALAAASSYAGYASAQDDLAEEHREARRRGEISPGTQTPSRASMVTTLTSGSPGAIQAALEYGERVECHECVPVVARYALEHDDALVREMSAWWLRRRIFSIGEVVVHMRGVLESDSDPVRRGRAAAALGEILDPKSLDPLTVATSDDSPIVRASAIRALGRLNHPQSHGAVAAGLEDSDVDVRRAVLDVALTMNFFREEEALIGALDDADAEVRMRAARILGALRSIDAVPALEAILVGDANRDARQAAAYALGRAGGAEARSALSAALASEQDSLVLDAVEVALAM